MYVYNFISEAIGSLLFVLQKSMISRIGNGEYRMDLRWFVRHLKLFIVSDNHCSSVQFSAMKIKVDTSGIFSSLQVAVIRKPCF